MLNPAPQTARVADLRMNVISLQWIIKILPVDVLLCMFTLTATVPGLAADSARVCRQGGQAHRHVQPKEGMER
jgi:hypothetical protein